MISLTRKQHETLTFVSERIRESGIAPSFDEIAVAVDLKSKSGIFRLLTALEDRGYIRRNHKCARAIEILALPENVKVRAPVSRPHLRSGRAVSSAPVYVAGSVNVPLVGRIASSTPIEALQNKLGDVPVQAGMIGAGKHYALEVTGDSMVNAGILDGDTIIIQETDKGATGEIVVALIDNSEVTLKRLRHRRDWIALEPANPAYETRLYSHDRVRIQGRLVGLVRRY